MIGGAIFDVDGVLLDAGTHPVHKLVHKSA